MTPAEFKTYTDLIGASPEQIAEWCNVSPRSARRWGVSHEPPADVVDLVLGWVDRFEQRLNLIVEELEQMEELHGTLPEAIELYRYRGEEHIKTAGIGIPLDVHSAMIRYIAGGLRQRGYETVIEFAPD